MKCDLCENTASVFLTQIVDGKMKKVNMCAECSKSKSVTDPTGFALADILAGNSNSMGIGHELKEGIEIRCEQCGFTRNDFKRTGRLGCSECYTILRQDLDNLLHTMHKGTKHRGKIPERAKIQQPAVTISELKNSLNKAVKDERFEEAAKIRDEIREVENNLDLFPQK